MRNVYFSLGAKNEQNLYEDIIIEALKIYGHDVLYLPREIIMRDNITKDNIGQFNAAYSIEMYIENIDGFEGDGTLMGKFGLEIRDQATFIVSKRQWQKLVGIWNNKVSTGRPNEGDVIYLPLTGSYFEIKFVDARQPFYQLSNVPVYKMQCELFEFSGEMFSTGNNKIDSLNSNNETEHVYKIADGNGLDFTIGELVEQTIMPATQSTDAVKILGNIDKFAESNGNLFVYIKNVRNTSGTYITFMDTTGEDSKLIGLTSGARWSILDSVDIDNADDDFSFVDSLNSNAKFEKDADEIIDFSVEDPWGES